MSTWVILLIVFIATYILAIVLSRVTECELDGYEVIPFISHLFLLLFIIAFFVSLYEVLIKEPIEERRHREFLRVNREIDRERIEKERKQKMELGIIRFSMEDPYGEENWD